MCTMADVVVLGGTARPSNSLQRTFDPPRIFAAAKTGDASNAAEVSMSPAAHILTSSKAKRY